MAKKKKIEKNPQFSLLSGNIKDQTLLDDELCRNPFAKGIAKLITKSPQDECFVMGIEGAWGEGKSYAIELIRRQIEAHNKEKTGKPVKWMVFNPWHFTDSEHLASLFLINLAIFLEKEAGLEPPKWLSRLNKKLLPVKKICDFLIRNRLVIKIALMAMAGVVIITGLFFNFILEYTGLTVASGYLVWVVFKYLSSPKAVNQAEKALVSVSSLLREYADILEEYEKSLSLKTLDQLKKDVQEKLSNDELPFSHIVVAIEDLDRLDPEEVRAMVQLMRMIADFPKVIYLVGYDRKHVINALGDLSGRHADADMAYAYGEGYLQKVVQAAYQLPRPADHAIAYMTFDRFYKIVSGIYGKDFNQEPYWQRISFSIAKLFTSLRVGERVINRSLHMATMLENKSNPADILVASYLMEYQPKLWDWLWVHRNAVLTGGCRLLEENKPMGLLGELPEEGHIQDQIRGDKNTKEEIVKLLRIVFPSLQYDHSYPFSDTERQSFRMGIPDFIEMYFKYEQSPATETSEIVADLLKARSDKGRDRALQKVRALGGYMPGYVIRDLKEIHDKKPFEWQKQALPLLRSLGKNFDNERNAISTLLFAVDLINAQPKKIRVQAFDDLLSHWLDDDVIYLTMHLFEKAAMENEFIEYDKHIAKSDYPLNLKLSETEFTKLKAKIEKEISLWAGHGKNERWLEHKQAAPMLFMWLRLNPEQARGTLDEWVENDRSIFELLNTMMDMSTIYNKKTGTAIKYGLSIHGLKKLTGMDGADIKARVNAAASNATYIAKKYPDVITAVRELPEVLPD